MHITFKAEAIVDGKVTQETKHTVEGTFDDDNLSTFTHEVLQRLVLDSSDLIELGNTKVKPLEAKFYLLERGGGDFIMHKFIHPVDFDVITKKVMLILTSFETTFPLSKKP